MRHDIRSLVNRAKRLDQAVLGRHVPDERSLSEKIRRPRPAVWSPRGRAAYGVILLGMFAAIVWLPDVMGVIAIAILLTAAFVVVAADERQRGRQSSADEGGPQAPHRGEPDPPGTSKSA